MLRRVFASSGTNRAKRKSILDRACRPLVEGLECRRLFAFGDLDLNFGTDGKQVSDLGRNDDIEAIAVGPGGVIYAVGRSVLTGAIDPSDFAVARYTADGILDATFDGDGVVTTNFLGGFDEALAVAVQADGKIVVVGSAADQADDTLSDIAIARYNTDGTLDTTFDGDGRLTLDFGQRDAATGVVIDADGKIVVAGFQNNGGGSNEMLVIRLNSDGSIDNTFGTGGVANTGSLPGAAGLAAAPGSGYYVISEGSVFHLTKITDGGALDTTFSGDGIVTTDIGAGSDSANAISVQADGKIVVTGESVPNAGAPLDTEVVVVRYTTTGDLDTTFSDDGIARLNLSGGIEQGNSIAVRGSDGMIVVGGFAQTSSGGNFLVVRINPNGTIDSAVQTDFNGSGDNARAIAIHDDGKIIAGGLASTGANTDFGLALYSAYGQDDIGIFRNGLVVLDSNGTRGYQAEDDVFFYGQPGDQPIVGDWNGDGITDIGLFRNGLVFLDTNGIQGYQADDDWFYYGQAGDIALAGDWDGDGITDLGLFRNGLFFLDTNGNRGYQADDEWFYYGQAGDQPIMGDWDGDGNTDVGLYRDGLLFLDTNGTRGYQVDDVWFYYGQAGDIAVAGDWDGDGFTDVGLFRNGLLFLDTNGTPGYQADDDFFYFGSPGDVPLIGYF